MRNDIKQLQSDRKRVFSIIQKNGPLTKNEIITIEDFKLTTLNRIIYDLEVLGLITETSVGESTGGRKPVLYDVNPTKAYVIGVDISRTYVQIIIANLKIQVLKERRFLLEESYSPERTLEHVIEIINNLMIELKVTKEQIMGIGVATVGPINRERGILLNPINFGGGNWQNVAIKEILQQSLEIPVVIDNGANTAVIGEYFFGCGRSHDNIAYINCGIGIRTGTITSKKIIRTINDCEDAFGHMVVDINGDQCYCGNYGCLENYSSIHAILKKFKDEIKKGQPSLVIKDLKEINYLDVFQAANEGDIVAKDIVFNSANVFGIALANYIKLLNPHLVILSGPIIYNSDMFYNVSTEVALKRINDSNANIIFSKGGHFKEYAMAVGAAAMVIESCLGE
jgi:predicted NBD/HSP70 family sugar kinase